MVNLNGHELEYYDDGHIYLVDGIIVPSITQMLDVRFGGSYSGIPADVLAEAARKGTEVHAAIEKLCKTGVPTELPEVGSFIALQLEHRFAVKRNEVPVILERDGEPIAAGRFDLELEAGGFLGGADIKRTSRLLKDKLTAQLNLYRLANRQTYGIEWTFLRGLQLREDVAKYVEIPVDEGLANDIIDEYLLNKEGIK